MYERNPLSEFFQRGLNISLPSDDLASISLFTKESLIEEYSMVA
jgi:AMP deaminase